MLFQTVGKHYKTAIHAMEKLWEEADDGDIDFDELSKRIQQIADWISAVEKSINAQPDWVGYY